MQRLRITTLLAAALLGGCGGGYTRLPAPVESRSAQAPRAEVVGSGASSQQAPVSAEQGEGPVAIPMQVEEVSTPQPLVSGQPPITDGTGTTAAETLDATPPVSTPAVNELLTQARTQWQAGEEQQAVATIERALRIEPYSPYLWQHLAALRLAQKRPDLAVQFAAKSNSYAGGNRDIMLRNWRIIAEARRLTGDDAGAREADARAASYAGGAN